MKTVPDQHVLKSRLRKALRARRTGIAATQRKKLDAAINRHLVEYAHAARLSDIAAYFAFDGEPDLFPALQALEADGVTIALPIIKNVAGRDTMVFGRWTRNCRMVPNRYGILEPAGTEEIPIPQFDLALLPLVGEVNMIEIETLYLDGSTISIRADAEELEAYRADWNR